MAACRTCKNAAAQHPTYLFTRCKNSQTGNWSVCSSPPCTAAIYRENTMHACRTCKTCRQAAKRALPDLLCRAGAAWQHAGHARMQRCSILHTYSLDAKTHKLETGLFAPAHHVQPLSIEKTPCMHAELAKHAGRQPNGHCRIYCVGQELHGSMQDMQECSGAASYILIHSMQKLTNWKLVCLLQPTMYSSLYMHNEAQPFPILLF